MTRYSQLKRETPAVPKTGGAAVRRSFSFCTHKRNVAKDQKARNDDVAFGMKRTSKAGRAGWLAKRTSRP